MIHTLQDLCYAYSVAEPVREMLFALQDRIDALEAQQQAEPVEREAFEKWAKFAAPYMDISRFGAGYSDCNTDYAWAGWQAAKRPWVNLTDEDFLEACQIAERGNYLLALQRIQISLKERNNG